MTQFDNSLFVNNQNDADGFNIKEKTNDYQLKEDEIKYIKFVTSDMAM